MPSEHLLSNINPFVRIYQKGKIALEMAETLPSLKLVVEITFIVYFFKF